MINSFKDFERYINEVKYDIEEIFYDIDEDYQVKVEYKYREIIVNISNKMGINLDDLSDNLDRLFEYMRKYQEIFRVSPTESYIVGRRGGLEPIGYANFIKKYDVQDLKDKYFSEIRLKWTLKTKWT